MSLYKVGPIWYAYITHKGTRVRRSLGTADKSEAQQLHDELKAALWQGAPVSSEEKTFKDAVLVWLQGGEKDLSDKYRLNKLGIEDLSLENIDTDLLEEKLSQHKNPSTRNRMINLIHAVLAEALKRGWIDKIPHMQRAKVVKSRIRWLTEDEWYRLQSELPCHLRNMARFAVATGLRENNVIGLEWSQVDMARRVAWIHPDQAKSKQAIGVPLSDAAMKVLETLKEANLNPRWVFTFNGKPVTKTSTKAWWEALKRAGLEGFRWHDLRHTWASWHVMAGTPLEVLQKLGGWATLQMVLNYAHLAPEHMAKYANNATVPSHKISQGRLAQR